MGLSLGGLLSAATGGLIDTFTGNVDALGNDVSQGASSLGFSDAQIQAATGYALNEAGIDTSGMNGGTIYDYGGTVPPIGGGGVSVYPTAGAMPMIGRYLPPLVAAAITKISQRLGGAVTSVAASGSKYWSMLSAWASKNPGVSLISLLVSLGLTVEEAAHFLAWGATKKKRRRRAGISARQLATTRRTLRKIVRMYHMLPHTSSRRVFGGSRTSIVKA